MVVEQDRQNFVSFKKSVHVHSQKSVNKSPRRTQADIEKKSAVSEQNPVL